MQTVTGLTSIVQISGMACSQFARLAHHNAETLRELIVRPATEANWLVLIYDGTETPAVFDSLASLSVIVADTSYATTWAAINDAKPFPILSKLDVGGGYPFDDDLLFRGNGGTLRSLRLSFSVIARNALCRFDILKRSGVTRMNSIHIGPVMEHDKVQLTERTDLPIVEQARRIFEVATALKANCDITGALVVFSTISTAPRPDTIQHLDFSKPIIELTGVILLISKLISLVSLTCNIRGLGASIESIPSNDRPRTLHAKYYPLSDNFRKLSVPSTAIASADMIARVAMLIAIVCPNFVHVDISPALREDFSREIAWSTYCRSFKPFVNDISRLIYSD
ncbi:hypothetical protein GGH94_003212 [Coemansia aciculifera]|uniref:Uncharacterized protein n=1 Tax=Coemansia aciculifera TaxID=417176 RepID=A0A9W8IHT6_9FUNG|nr:hypothetical protein GGH94_003212 [Coemansia aciculifera]